MARGETTSDRIDGSNGKINALAQHMKTLPESLFLHHLSSLKSLLADLVRLESPSTNKTEVDRFGRRLAEELRGLDGKIQDLPQAQVGDQLVCRWGSGTGGILI